MFWEFTVPLKLHSTKCASTVWNENIFLALFYFPPSHVSVWIPIGQSTSVCLSRLKTIILDISFGSWGALIEWGLPSVLEGLWGAFHSWVVWFLAWGLCRLELPSEMFTCLLFLCLEEGVVSYVHNPNLCVFIFFSRLNVPVIWWMHS